MELRITLQPKQREALKASDIYPIVFMGGAKGGGKSYAIRAREIIRRLKYKNTHGLIVRKTYPELLANHIRKFFSEYPQTFEWYKKAEKTIYYPNGSTTEFSYLQHTDDVYTYQGREYDDISVDEVTQHEYEVIKILRSSLRTTNPLIKPRMFLTGNPGGIGHDEVKRVFIDREFLDDENPNDFHFVQAFVSDNQALMAADSEYAERLKDLPERLRKAYLEGNWEIAEDKAFKIFSRLKHIIKPVIPDKQFAVILSMDWGFSDKSKFAAYLTAVMPVIYQGQTFNRTITFKEWSGNEKSPYEWAEIIYNDCKELGIRPNKGYPDSAMLDRQSDGSKAIGYLMEERWKQLNGGVNWLSLTRSAKNRVTRIATTHNWLSIAPDDLPYSLFTENCPYITTSLPKLRWHETKLDDIAEGDDHGWDGWSYGLLHIRYIKLKPGSFSVVKTEKRTHLTTDERGLPVVNPNTFFNSLS
ncbi:MAG: phage terminase large subunit [Candidatus Roizmanbacteria bacterium]|nr:phage terminase large subunit [Candidatus Roizmanbacteria bacterium]